MFELILQALFSGVLLGGSYALIALGLAIVFGNMKIVNLAHGELVLLAAYLAYASETILGAHPLLAIPLAMIVVCGLSVVIYLLVNLIKSDRELNSLLLTYGCAIVLTNGILLIWKSDVHSSANAWFQDALVIGNLFSMNSEWVFFLISIVLLLVGAWWLKKSWYGRAVRAVSNNRDAAKLMGINPRVTEIVSFIIAGVLASFAGVALFSTSFIQPEIGNSLTIKAFIITVLAGIGSIHGVLLAAILLGVVESLTITLFSSSLQELTGMGLFLLVLFVMPNGLFGGKRRMA
ncbi:branched-chain amino acid ABC transporter permease [Ignatzschineria rhizosphaerae]|uniref:Branched-chain amino acid ABC transporter permease n=1 Tax=Ignatzschineria rhizosphaerae TaxID=2923279 RepID=A0ABY3X509_9GAMM|nr:branched-chain amino acid ABC transporter permease [Ignatzschineria rhizosphaerae]UNM96846.1 branched-chain amino acid ABC transporter permease [Ignatzschineria rhizosphaerae]